MSLHWEFLAYAAVAYFFVIRPYNEALLHLQDRIYDLEKETEEQNRAIKFLQENPL